MSISFIHNLSKKEKIHNLIALLTVFTLSSIYIYDLTNLALTKHQKSRGFDDLKMIDQFYTKSAIMIIM